MEQGELLVLGIESSCDETGLALYSTSSGLLAHALHSQVVIHAEYGGVVPELASRAHIEHVLPLTQKVLADACARLHDIDAIAYTQGPGLAGALLVGASFAEALAFSLQIPTIPIHHLEGHLLAPLLEEQAPCFPFIALLVSGGHTQLIHVAGIGQYTLLGDTLDDAVGEAFDKVASLLGLAYPGGRLLAQLADQGYASDTKLPRPLLKSGDLNFSFSGLKTAVLMKVKQGLEDRQQIANLAWEFQEAVTDVLVVKSLAALDRTGITSLVVSGGVSANRRLREKISQAVAGYGGVVYYPRLEFCTDNGAMIAFAGAIRFKNQQIPTPETLSKHGFGVSPRWSLETLQQP